MSPSGLHNIRLLLKRGGCQSHKLQSEMRSLGKNEKPCRKSGRALCKRVDPTDQSLLKNALLHCSTAQDSAQSLIPPTITHCHWLPCD
jgi:hypothetical protein